MHKRTNPLPKPRTHLLAVDAADAIVVCILGVALLAGKIKGVRIGPLNTAIGIATVVAAALLLLEDLRVLRGRWAWSGWALLCVVLVVFGLANF